jgi:hypothetical protein
MTTYGLGLEYNDALDILAHGLSPEAAGVYTDIKSLQIDDMGHVVDVEVRSDPIRRGYIDGLGFQWESADSVRVYPGAAYIPQIDRIVELDDELVVPIPGDIDENYFLYFNEQAGSGNVSVDTELPADPYFGNARTMLATPSNRYLGMVKNDMFGNVIQFSTEVAGGYVVYIYGESHDSQQLMAADDLICTTTAQTWSIGLSNADPAFRLVPPSAFSANFYLQRADNATIRLGWPLDQVWGTPPIYFDGAAGDLYVHTARLGPDQTLYYKASTNNGTGLYIFVTSYFDRR